MEYNEIPDRDRITIEEETWDGFKSIIFFETTMPVEICNEHPKSNSSEE